MSEVHTVSVHISTNKILELFVHPNIDKDAKDNAWKSAEISTALNKFSIVRMSDVDKEDILDRMIQNLIIIAKDIYSQDEILKLQILDNLNYLKNIKDLVDNKIGIVEISIESQITKAVQTFYIFNVSLFEKHISGLNVLFKYLNKYVIYKEFSSYMDIMYIILPHVYGSNRIGSSYYE